MLNLEQEAQAAKFAAFFAGKQYELDMNTDSLANPTFQKFVRDASKCPAFKHFVTDGATQGLFEVATSSDMNQMSMIFITRIMVGFTLGFQYAQSLYEQKELEKL